MKKIVFLLLTLAFINISYSQISPTDSVPVRLRTFNAINVNNNKIKLHWQVTCFLEYANFRIQRSNDGVNFTDVNTLQADNLRCLQPFDFEDENIGGKIFYRLKVGDKNGKEYVSKIVLVTGKNNRFEINSLSPSIITSNTTLSISSAFADKAEILITNLQGINIKKITTVLNVGYNDIQLNLSQLSKGNYIITVNNAITQNKTIRFLKL